MLWKHTGTVGNTRCATLSSVDSTMCINTTTSSYAKIITAASSKKYYTIAKKKIIKIRYLKKKMQMNIFRTLLRIFQTQHLHRKSSLPQVMNLHQRSSISRRHFYYLNLMTQQLIQRVISLHFHCYDNQMLYCNCSIQYLSSVQMQALLQ